ncbi:Sporulation protein YqfC [Tepidanaerobacter acetatoxydans Re1]|uniref:Sporulation protein YqfC n=1 Tax=Tepidanaerobacter acetatoxydans (strain DSM 21804 / JCM 16047 / Re1) TaxID=1209989 RepID=F4LSY5_TEPAE|nr:sporulation protein YqfC [Tepidanaerobacter acetatoxydans]AEE91254.1 sporulation protein YqfC [Tepidanaerobacter acetatoxydans Re1]CCP25932.1 Sporulation protein YqfC [Tepidanaerobacter acetatoxydans Re1]
MSEGIRQKISDVLDLPQDVILNVPKVILTGRIAAFIENHKGIIQYNSELVKINTSIGVVCIKGADLLIKTIIADEITVEGKITAIELEE